MRADIIIKCTKAIRAMSKPGGITAASMADALGVSKRTAYRYVDAISLVLPVFQHEGYPAKFELSEPVGSVRQRRDCHRPPYREKMLGLAIKTGCGSSEFN